MLLIRRLSNEARVFKFSEAVGKNVGGNAFQRILQLSIGHITAEQVANHQQRPLIANQVKGACDGAGRAGKTARRGFRFYPFRVPAGLSDLHSESQCATFPSDLQSASYYEKRARLSWKTPSCRTSISPNSERFPAQALSSPYSFWLGWR